jgi:hypothetical protein
VLSIIKGLVFPTGSPIREVLDSPVSGTPDNLEAQEKVGN